MNSRFRGELTAVPAVRIKIGKQGFTTTIGWQENTASHGRSGPPSLRQVGDPRQSGPLPTDHFLIPGTRQDFGGGNVSHMTSPGLNGFKELLLATRRREQEIQVDIGKAKWQLRAAWTAMALGWITLVSAVVRPIRERARSGLATRRAELETLHGNLEVTKISVNFDMDSAVAEPHSRMQSAFDKMISSCRTWTVETKQNIDRVKARSWAGTIVSRKPACQIASNRDPSFACNADPSVVRASAFFVIGRGLST